MDPKAKQNQTKSGKEWKDTGFYGDNRKMILKQILDAPPQSK